MSAIHVSPTSLDTNRSFFAPQIEKFRTRMLNDEELIRTITTLEADAKVTASNASQAVYQAQQALVAAHAWLAAAMATYESYRLEHLRLLDAVTKSRTLLHLPPSLPDELIIQIAQLCLDDFRHKIHDEMTRRDGERAEAKDIASVSWTYPFALSQVCQRWRRAVIGCPRLWAYKENSYHQLSPKLSNLVSLRAQACSLDVFWDMNAEDPPSIPSDFNRWRSARLILTKTTAEPFPFTTTQQYYTLTSLSLTSCRSIRAPLFTSRHLALMPMLSKLSLIDVQFVAPPPHIHSSPMDLHIRYHKVISFRARDMADIATVFPRLHNFSLDIRGPYINNNNGHSLSRSASINNLNTSNLPFSFPELERLDISAKDLSHSLGRLQTGNMPKLSYLRLRDNMLPVASNFITHLERTGVIFQTLSLSELTAAGMQGFPVPKSVHTLEIELERGTIEAFQQLLQPTQLISPVTFSPTSQARVPPFPFPFVSALSLLPFTGAEMRKGRTEAALLLAVARIVRERNLSVTEPHLFRSSMASASSASVPGASPSAPSVPLRRDSPTLPSEVITLKPIVMGSTKAKAKATSITNSNANANTNANATTNTNASPKEKTATIPSPRMHTMPLRTTREDSKSSGMSGMSSEDALADPFDSGDSSGGSSSSIRFNSSSTITAASNGNGSVTQSPKALKRDPHWLSPQNQQNQQNQHGQTSVDEAIDNALGIIYASATPILDVRYTPQTSKGRAAMEDVYKVLVEVRKQWKELDPANWANGKNN